MANHGNVTSSSAPSGSNIQDTTKPSGQHGNIKSSSQHGFSGSSQAQPVTEAKETTQKITPVISSGEVKSTIRDVAGVKITAKDEREAMKLLKSMLSTNMQSFRGDDFRGHNMIFMRYDAKYKNKVYDRTPLILVLRRSKGYVLGLNFHWLPVPLRLILLKIILKMNKNNIKRGYPISITYQMLKPIITKMGMAPVIRLYIFNRISRRGLVIPPEYWLTVAKLRAESFTGGYSADTLYKKAVQDFRKSKINRTRRESIF